MLNILFLIVTSSTTCSIEPQSWVQDILNSPIGQKVKVSQVSFAENTASANLKEEGKPEEGGIKRAGKVIVHAKVYNDPVRDSLRNQMKEALDRARALFEDGQYEEAYQTVKTLERDNPEYSNNQANIEYALMTGRYAEAYVSIVSVFRQLESRPNGKPISPHYMLMLSLASALYDEVYPGQAEFARDMAVEGLAHQALLNVEMDRKLANRKDAKAVAVMSCMGLGLKYGRTPYLEFALRLDPSNLIVANELICYYGLRERKADIVRIAKSVLKALPVGDENRAKFEKDLADNQ